MASDSDLDLEVVDAGVAHALYAASLVNLAIALNGDKATGENTIAVSKYASQLCNALKRCGIDSEIPSQFQSVESIMHVVSGSFMTDIGNSLVRVHGRRQEVLWLITCLLGGGLSGEDDAKEKLRPHAVALSESLELPANVVDACLNNQSLKPLRDWVLKASDSENSTEKQSVFIGHGRSPVWRELKDLLSERLGLQCVEFNSVSPAGIATKERLQEMLGESVFAFLIMTAEDSHKDGSRHARENVVHEIGLFQGRLGFERAIVLLESGCEEFSNIAGVGQIRFPKGNILAKSEEIRMALEREGKLKS